MNDTGSSFSRRRLLRYGGVGVALAIAGCGGNDDSSNDGDDDESAGDGSSDDGSNDDESGGDGSGDDGSGDDGETLPDDPASAFELAGDGADPYRQWLDPEYTLSADSTADTRQLYQFNDYQRAEDAGWDSGLLFRDRFAESFGVEPESFERELLVGPVEDGTPRRIFFGSFDTLAISESLESSGFELTGEDGDFTVFEGRIAVSEEAIVQHDSFEAFLAASRAESETISDTDEDVGLLLDLVPSGALVTFSRREGDDDLAVDAMSVSEFGDDDVQSHAVRTLVFAEGTTISDERIRELVVENSPFEEIVTQETHGRVAMVEVRR